MYRHLKKLCICVKKIFFDTERRQLRRMVKQAIKQLPSKKSCQKENSDKCKIIVSFTTFPKRILSAGIVVSSMMNQTIKPDVINLYLSKEEFPKGISQLPHIIKKEIECGLNVVFVEKNLKPHKKYFYALQDYPDDIVVVIDDDIVYPNDLIEVLYNCHKSFPNAVVAQCAHTLLKNGCPISEYVDLEEANESYIPKMSYQALGAGGVLYPPHSMHSELFNIDFILNNCLSSDDIWLKAMQLMNNTPVVITNTMRLVYIPCSQEIALWKTNCYGTNPKNEENFKKIYMKYNNFFGDKDTLLSRLVKE